MPELSSTDETLHTDCLCGKTGIKHVHAVKNKITKVVLKTIGSVCIEKFGNNAWSMHVHEYDALMNQLLHLYHGFQHNQVQKVNSQYFSKKLLFFLYEQGLFIANKYNDFNSHNDYEFLTKYFNKHKPTAKQIKKAKGLLFYHIKPKVINNINNYKKQLSQYVAHQQE